MVAVSLYNLINTFWVAKLGYQSVAAITVVMPFFIFSMAIGVGTGIGINALSSRHFGQRDTETPNRVVGQAVFLSVVVGLFMLLLTNLFPVQILKICGATPDIIGLGEQYIRVLGWAIIPFFFTLVSRNIFHASGDTVRPMLFTVVSQLCNAILDPFLIFGLWIFPELGIRGAALGTVIATLLGMSYALWYIISGRTAYRLKLRHCLPDWKIIKDIYRVGLPSVFMDATESVIFALLNHIAAGYGSLVLAALGIGMRISDLAFMPILGVSSGLLPIVGFSLGAKLWNRLWSAVRLSTVWLMMFMAAATILLEIFTPQVVKVFNSDPDLVAIAVPGMRIFCASLPLVGPAIIFITTFQVLSKGKTAWLLSLARQIFFFVPALYVLPYLLGLKGVWIAMPVSDTMAFITTGIWILREYRIQKRGLGWAKPLPAV